MSYVYNLILTSQLYTLLQSNTIAYNYKYTLSSFSYSI